MNKKIIIILIAIVVAIGLVFVFTSQSNAPEETANETVNNSDVSQEVSQPTQVYTAAEVAERNTESNCWTIINGEVYDITSYIPNHPGGDEVLRACGVDSTTLFFERTTAEGEVIGSGTPHSSRAQSQLDQYKIGTLQ